MAVSEADLALVSAQLGRPARGVLEVAARCVCGNPVVVKTEPRLADTTPFPTLYYLTEPAATAAVSTLEASGLMVELQAQLEHDAVLAERYRQAHLDYLRERDAILAVPELAGISAGGMPNRVKCLHALVAHALAKGPGVNPIGDLALAACTWSPKRCSCRLEPH
jgi:uncharacterized protein